MKVTSWWKRKAKAHLELNPVREAKSSRKGFYRYRRTRGCGDKGHGKGRDTQCLLHLGLYC